MRWRSTLLFLCFLGLTSVWGCSSSSPKGKRAKKPSLLKRLEKEVEQTTNLPQTIAHLEAALYQVTKEEERQKIQEWLEELEKKLEVEKKRQWERFRKKAEEIYSSQGVEEAIRFLKNPPPLLRQPPYVDRIVEKIKEWKGGDKLTYYVTSLLQRAKLLAKYRQYDMALTVLSTVELIDEEKPKHLLAQLERARRQIEREKRKWELESKKWSELPWYSAIQKDNFYNWQAAENHESLWGVKGLVLIGEGVDDYANPSWVVLRTVPKDSQGLDVIECDELEDCLIELEFFFEEGEGLEVWLRVDMGANQLSSLTFRKPDYREGVWYKVHIEVRGNTIRAFCLTNFREQETDAQAERGTLGFRPLGTTKVKIRNVRIKVLSSS